MFRVPFFLTLSVTTILLTGCGEDKPAAGAPPPQTRTKPLVYETKPGTARMMAELTIPRLAPKPVIWMDAWVGEPKVSAERAAAKEMARMADALKSAGDREKAEAAYKSAQKADPAWPYPYYQSACNYDVWKKPDLAAEEFAKAVEAGFVDFPTALDDNEIEGIRRHPDFSKWMKTIRERYVKTSKNSVGQPLADKPDGNPPPGGWPMMLLMHGFGDTHLNYIKEALNWVEEGFVAVAVPGSIPGGDGNFVWPPESTDQTDSDLQAIVKSPIFDGIVNRRKVYLLGFSQGALHAILLTARNTDRYAGVVAISPGGSLLRQLLPPPVTSEPRAGLCVFIHGDQEPHAPIAKAWEAVCLSSGWKFRYATHPGGHQFPQNWAVMRLDVAEFIKSSW